MALKVERYSPSGNASEMSPIVIKFSQQMVALGSISEKIPGTLISIVPEAKGEWRWEDLKTLKFRPSLPGFKNACKYVVTLDVATVNSLEGKKMEAKFSFSFKTQPIKINDFWPDMWCVPTQLFGVRFNVAVDAEKVMQHLKVWETVKGGQKSEFKNVIEVVSHAEVKKFCKTAEFKKNYLRSDWYYDYYSGDSFALTSVFFRFKGGLKLDSSYYAKFFKQERYWSTYGKMAFTEYYPNDSNRPTKNQTYFTIKFSNPIAIDNKDLVVHVTPDLPLAKESKYVKNKEGKGEYIEVDKKPYYVERERIFIYGRIPRGNISYTCTVKNVKDIYGQKGPELISKTIKIHPLPYEYRSNYRDLNVIDTSKDYAQVYCVSLCNVSEVNIKIYHVEPQQFQKFDSDYEVKFAKPKFDLKVPTAAKLDEYFVFNFPIKWEYLQNSGGRTGQIIIELKGTKFMSDKPSWYANPVRGWFSFSKVSMDVFTFPDKKSYVYLNSLKQGEPIDPKEVELYDCNMKKLETTVENSLLKTDLTILRDRNRAILIAKHNNDFVFLRSVYAHSSQFCGTYRWFCFDDRKIYQPGDTVHIKGLIRRIEKKDSGYDIKFPQRENVHYEVKDPRGQKIAEGNIKSSALGAFSFKIFVPKNASNLGDFRITMKYENSTSYHSFKVEEFKMPKFLVDVKCLNKSTIYPEDAINVELSAKYLDLSPMDSCKTKWSISKMGHFFTPISGYVFSESSGRSGRKGKRGGRRSYRSDVTTFNKKTDENGICKFSFKQHEISGATFEGKAVSYSISGECQDIDNSTIGSYCSAVVYPSECFVGIKSRKWSINLGKILPASFIVCDQNGFVKSGIEILIEIRNTRVTKPVWEKRTLSKSIAIDFIDLIDISKPVPGLDKAGYYTLRCTVKDSKDRKHVSQCTFTITAVADTGVEKIEREEVELVANKTSYVAGDVAKIFVNSPFDKDSYCSGVLFGIVETVDFAQKFEIKKGMKNMIVLDVPIKDCYVPNLSLQCALFGSKISKKLNKPMPSYGVGTTGLTIENKSKILDVSVSSSEKVYQPGDNAELIVKLQNDNVKDTELVIVVVDKAILSLTGYELQNPVNNFYTTHSGSMLPFYLRDSILMKIVEKKTEEKEKCKEEKKEKGKGRSKKDKKKKKKKSRDEGSRDEEPQEPVTFRKDFNPLAYYNPSLRFDEKGIAKVSFKLPDQLSSFEVWALVAKEKKFGFANSNFLTDLEFQCEGRFPMFLNFQDEIHLQVVLFNKTEKKVDVSVVTKFDGKLQSIGKTPLEIVVVPNKKTKVLIPVKAIGLGNAKVQVIATVKNSKLRDSFEEIIEIKRPETYESFCQYGEIMKDKDEVSTIVSIPYKEVFPDYGGISLDLTSTALSSLTDCFLYLYGYKFNCFEQITSKVLGILSVGDILQAFNVPDFPKQSVLYDVINNALVKYKDAQHSDGGFGFWSSSTTSWPYVSLYICFSLCKIKEKIETSSNYKSNLKFNDAVFNKAKGYCLGLRDKKEHYMKNYSKRSCYSLTAFSLYILTHFNLSQEEKKKSVAAAEELFKSSEEETEDSDQMSLEALGYVMFALAKLSDEKMSHKIVQSILQKLNNSVNETAQTANFITTFSRADSYVMLSSKRRTDGILLMLLCELKPKVFMGILPKIVKGLLAHKVKGKHYNNTQENCYILFGLLKYFQTFEKDVPAFEVGFDYGKVNGKTKFKGRSTKTERFDIPMKEVIAQSKELEKESKKNAVVIKKEGKGLAYYRIGFQYSPSNLNLEAKDRGFKISQVYEEIEKKDKDDKEYPLVEKEKGGAVLLKQGRLYRVRVSFSSETRRYHTALVSCVPAGCTLLNPNIRTNVIPKDHVYTSYGPVHVNYRKDRLEAFSTSLSDGSKTYSYVIRAENTGLYSVAPVYIEEMYSPEIFGRDQTLTFSVK